MRLVLETDARKRNRNLGRLAWVTIRDVLLFRFLVSSTNRRVSDNVFEPTLSAWLAIHSSIKLAKSTEVQG